MIEDSCGDCGMLTLDLDCSVASATVSKVILTVSSSSMGKICSCGFSISAYDIYYVLL